MPRYLPNLRFSDCWSSIGNITFFHIDGRCYWRTRPRPVFPETPGQIHQLDLHRRALAAWRTISSEEQHQWNAYAKDVPSHRPPYDNSHHITGHNLFVSAYHGFAQLGNEHVPVPMPYPDFPSMSLKIVGSRVVDVTDLELTGRLLLSDAQTPERWQLLARLQLTAPGGGYDAGKLRSVEVKMKNAAVIKTRCGIVVMIKIPNYRSVCNMELPDGIAYISYCLLDTYTGYRNSPIKCKQRLHSKS